MCSPEHFQQPGTTLLSQKVGCLITQSKINTSAVTDTIVSSFMQELGKVVRHYSTTWLLTSPAKRECHHAENNQAVDSVFAAAKANNISYLYYYPSFFQCGSILADYIPQ